MLSPKAARVTPGFSGADLANVINEAALLSARRNASGVTFDDFEAAMDAMQAEFERFFKYLQTHADELTNFETVPEGSESLVPMTRVGALRRRSSHS